MIEIWGGLLLGVAGSAHCMVMCGPFAAAAAPRGSRAAVHHASRVAVYAALGAASGLLGSVVKDAGAGRALAVIAALTLVAQASLRWRTAVPVRMGARITSALQAMRRASLRHPAVAGVGVGIVNGLLPCGLVYAALVASAGLAGPLEGAVFMTAFGAGTTPAVMIAARLAGIVVARRPALKKLAPAALVLVAILVAVRGWAGSPPVHPH